MASARPQPKPGWTLEIERQDGKVTATHLGAMSKSRMVEWLKESAPSLA